MFECLSWFMILESGWERSTPAAHPSGTNLAGPHSIKGVKGSCSPKCTNVYWTLPLPTWRTSLVNIVHWDPWIRKHPPRPAQIGTLYRRSFEYSGALHYNRLPLTSKLCPTTKSFKTFLKTQQTSYLLYVIGPAWKPATVDAAFPIQIKIYLYLSIYLGHSRIYACAMQHEHYVQCTQVIFEALNFHGFRGLTSNLENLVPRKILESLFTSSIERPLYTVGVWSF